MLNKLDNYRIVVQTSWDDDNKYVIILCYYCNRTFTRTRFIYTQVIFIVMLVIVIRLVVQTSRGHLISIILQTVVAQRAPSRPNRTT